MDHAKLLNKVDHTLLAQGAKWEEIRQICDDAIRFKTASVCIPPSYVKQAKGYVGDRMKICTVIGFPNGYNTTAVKEFETKDAIANGADEIDMVINVGALKDKDYDYVKAEIEGVRDVLEGKTLKVIIETSLLTKEEIKKMTEICNETFVNYIKTSTGFGKRGASLEDIDVINKYKSELLQIKASGGIKTLKETEEFIKKGVTRIGTSSASAIMREWECKQ